MKEIALLSTVISLLLTNHVDCQEGWSTEIVDLPESHMTRYLNAFHDEAEKCQSSPSCAGYRGILDTGLCWGYEPDCPQHLGYSDPQCPGDHKGWVSSKSQQLNTFFDQADFGFVKQQIHSMSVLCQPETNVSHHQSMSN